MGWFDCVASKYGCRLQGTTDVCFTVLDVLGYLDEIPVCTGYEIDGEVTTQFPVTAKLEKAKPVLTILPGWKSDIRGIKNYDELPVSLAEEPEDELQTAEHADDDREFDSLLEYWTESETLTQSGEECEMNE